MARRVVSVLLRSSFRTWSLGIALSATQWLQRTFPLGKAGSRWSPTMLANECLAWCSLILSLLVAQRSAAVTCARKSSRSLSADWPSTFTSSRAFSENSVLPRLNANQAATIARSWASRGEISGTFRRDPGVFSFLCRWSTMRTTLSAKSIQFRADRCIASAPRKPNR